MAATGVPPELAGWIDSAREGEVPLSLVLVEPERSLGSRLRSLVGAAGEGAADRIGRHLRGLCREETDPIWRVGEGRFLLIPWEAEGPDAEGVADRMLHGPPVPLVAAVAEMGEDDDAEALVARVLDAPRRRG